MSVEPSLAPTRQGRISTGIAGLDEVLGGGLTRDRLYLVEGSPGSGKTTMAMQFLLEGLRQGEPGLYVALSETESELRAVAASHGWNLEGLEIFELIGVEELALESEQSILHPSEVELGETTRAVIERVTAINPVRLVFDSLSELRMLAQNPLRYRRQILALKNFFARRNCTVLMLDDQTAEPGDLQLHSIAHGVIRLEQRVETFGPQRRRLQVVKMRGLKFLGGFHDIALDLGGVSVFPRLVAASYHREHELGLSPTGSVELDALLGGGLTRGTNTLLNGPSGVGKTTTAVRCMVAALERGETAAYFLFDEGLPTLLARSRSFGMDLGPHIAAGRLNIGQIDPAELSPGEFAARVRTAIEVNGASFVVIDSLNAYLHAMPGEQHLMLQMHELLTYLNQQGATTLVVLGQHGVIGDIRNDIDLSYLSDGIVLFRYFEAMGEVRKAFSVVKSRTTRHERSIREFTLGPDGLVVGEALADFTGVLSGTQVYLGSGDLLDQPRLTA